MFLRSIEGIYSDSSRVDFNCSNFSHVSNRKEVKKKIIDDALEDALTNDFVITSDKSLCYLRGKFCALPERVDLTSVTRNQILADYNHCITQNIEGYCFLRVLTRKEVINFLNALTLEVGLSCYKTRAINTWIWIRMLQNIKLECTYIIYR